MRRRLASPAVDGKYQSCKASQKAGNRGVEHWVETPAE